MKYFIQFIPALAMGIVLSWTTPASAQLLSDSGMDIRSTLTISSNGTSEFVSSIGQSRVLAEQQLRMMERYSHMSGNDDNDESTNTPADDQSATNQIAEPKPYTDDELQKKLVEFWEKSAEREAAVTPKISVEVNKEKVTVRFVESYPSLTEMLADSSISQAAGLPTKNIKLETGTNGTLVMTLMPYETRPNAIKTARAEWKMGGMKMAFRLVFPGNVISSSLPETRTNATWLEVDGKNDASLDALARLYTTNVVIVAEAGGLKLSEPLESKKLRLARRSFSGGDKTPITDAGPGFLAQAQSITTTTLHLFPGGEDYFKNHGYESQTGVVVNVKLFAPKGRTILNLSGAHALSAQDDKGRSLANEDADERTGYEEYSGDSSHDNTSLAFNLRLQLPQADAQSLQNVSGEAIVTTVGKWKEFVVTNLQANATNEIDLSSILPGARMTIKKVSFADSQFEARVVVKGPEDVSKIKLSVKLPGSEGFNTYDRGSSDSKSDKGETVRTFDLGGYGSDSQASLPAFVLTVRMPEDLRRERVKFKLDPLDLF